MEFRRKTSGSDKVELQMTPMIDVVFQLLIFFLFSFKIVPVEGEIAVNMPPITAGASKKENESDPIEKIRIKLVADDNGQLTNIILGENALGTDPRALAAQLKDTIVGPSSEAKDVEVDIDADRGLRYYYVIRATNAVMFAGIERINFTDPLTRGPAAK